MLTGLLFWRAFCQPCDVTVQRMAPLEGTGWGAMLLNISSTWWVPCRYPRWAQLLKTVCPFPPSPIPLTPILCWPYINAHLKNYLKSPENCPSAINKVGYITRTKNTVLYRVVKMFLQDCLQHTLLQQDCV